jgi:hypothetical protein
MSITLYSLSKIRVGVWSAQGEMSRGRGNLGANVLTSTGVSTIKSTSPLDSTFVEGSSFNTFSLINLTMGSSLADHRARARTPNSVRRDP